MILHVYHCNLAIFRDKPRSTRNRPEPIQRVPERPGEADVEFLPPTRHFDDALLGRLLEELQDVSIDGSESAVRIDWNYLGRALNVDRNEVRALLSKAHSLGVIDGLTLRYNHDRWMKYSHDKGCLVVMACVEKNDYLRDAETVGKDAATVIGEVRVGLVGESPKSDFLNRLLLVPNVHLGARAEIGTDQCENLRVIGATAAALTDDDWYVSTNSYGYTKVVELAINAHVLGFVLRTV